MIVGLCQMEMDGGREQCEQRLVVTFGEWQKHRKGAWEKRSPAEGQEKQIGLWSGYWGAVKGFRTERRLMIATDSLCWFQPRRLQTPEPAPGRCPSLYIPHTLSVCPGPISLTSGICMDRVAMGKCLEALGSWAQSGSAPPPVAGAQDSLAPVPYSPATAWHQIIYLSTCLLSVSLLTLTRTGATSLLHS